MVHNQHILILSEAADLPQTANTVAVGSGEAGGCTDTLWEWHL